MQVNSTMKRWAPIFIKKKRKIPSFFSISKKTIKLVFQATGPKPPWGVPRQKKFSISNTQKLPDLKSTSVSNSMTFKNPVKNKAPNIQNVH